MLLEHIVSSECAAWATQQLEWLAADGNPDNPVLCSKWASLRREHKTTTPAAAARAVGEKLHADDRDSSSSSSRGEKKNPSESIINLGLCAWVVWHSSGAE